MQSGEDKDPEKPFFSFPYGSCKPVSGWKDYSTKESAVDCGEYGKFFAEATEHKDGSLDPAAHTKGPAFGGTGSHPNRTADLNQLKGVRPASEEEWKKVDEFKEKLGPTYDEDTAKTCRMVPRVLKNYAKASDKTKANSKQFQEFSALFENVCKKDDKL